MSHFAGLSLENFRIFQERTDFEFAPITVLTGTNGSGKSSLIKALKLIQANFQKMQEGDFWEELDFSNGDHQLGSYSNAVCRDNPDGLMAFHFPFELVGVRDPLEMAFYFEQDPTNNLDHGRIVQWEIVKKLDGEAVVSVRPGDEEGKKDLQIDFSFFRAKYLEWVEYMNGIQDLDISVNTLLFDKETIDEKIIKYLEVDLESPKEYFWKRKEAWKLRRDLYNFNSSPVNPSLSWDKHLKSFDHLGLPNSSISGPFSPVEDTRFPNDYFPSSEEKKEMELIDVEGFVPKYYNPGMPLLYYDNLSLVSSSEDQQEILEGGDSIERREEINSKINTEFDLLNTFKYSAYSSPKELLTSALYPSGKRQNDDSWYENPNPYYDPFEDDFEDFYDREPSEPKPPSALEFLSEACQGGNISYPWYFEDRFWPNWNYFFGIFIKENIFDSMNLLKKKYSNQNGRNLGAIRSTQGRIIFASLGKDDLGEVIFNLQKFPIEKWEIVKDFLNYWLTEFKLSNEVSIEPIADGTAYQIKLKRGNLLENLADQGYGYSQLLPIILNIVVVASKYMKQNFYYGFMEPGDNEKDFGYTEVQPTVLLIEEPETNLHPKLQALLADFFVDASKKFNMQFILETHSEYLIRKLQVLTAKDEITPDDTAIYYFFPPDEVPKDRKQVERLHIGKDGGLDKEFGPGFFDEALNWKLELMKLKNRNN